jgi:hypothetical protein
VSDEGLAFALATPGKALALVSCSDLQQYVAPAVAEDLAAAGIGTRKRKASKSSPYVSADAVLAVSVLIFAVLAKPLVQAVFASIQPLDCRALWRISLD